MLLHEEDVSHVTTFIMNYSQKHNKNSWIANIKAFQSFMNWQLDTFQKGMHAVDDYHMLFIFFMSSTRDAHVLLQRFLGISN